jgi:hypothetical protein
MATAAFPRSGRDDHQCVIHAVGAVMERDTLTVLVNSTQPSA